MPGIRVALLQADGAGTVIGTHPRELHHAYSPYGFIANNSLTTLLGFNSQPYERISRRYPLGAGRRFYAPGRQTFGQPDSRSPFGEGSINTYAYCHNDPINRHDPSGQMFEWLRWRVLNWTGLNSSAPRLRPTQTTTPALPSRPTRTDADHNIVTVENSLAVARQAEIINAETAITLITTVQAVNRWFTAFNVHQLIIAPVMAVVEIAKHLRGVGPYASSNLPRPPSSPV